MVKRKWYVVTVGRDIGVFPTWIEVGPLVKGVSGAIHQSFLTRAEATRMFAEEQARGRTRIVDPDLDVPPAVSPPQRARNYSTPSPFPQATSTFGMHRGHDRSPLSVHPTKTSSRNRTTASTFSPVLLSDRRAPIVSDTSNLSPATFTSNPRSGLDISPSLRRLQLIQATLEQELAARSQSQVQTPLCSNTNTPNSQSLTPVPGPTSSSRNHPLRRAETAPDIPQSPRTYTPGPLPASANRNRQLPSTPVGFNARAPPVNHIRHSSHTNTYAYTQPDMTTGGARTSNPPVKSASEPTSPSRGLQRTPPDTFRGNSRWASFGQSPGRSSVSPHAIVRTPEWLPSYPTARTPSPDSDFSTRTRSPSTGPSDVDELLSPLSNVNLNSFALDDYPRRGMNTAERNVPGPSVNSSTRPPNPRMLDTRSQSPPVFANATPQSSVTPTGDRPGSTPSHGGPNRGIELTHDSDPRSPIVIPNQIPALACKNALEISFAHPSPRVNTRPLTSSPLLVDGHGPSLLFRQ